jgi:hypothetical protein
MADDPENDEPTDDTPQELGVVKVPVEDWIVTPVSDSSEFLDRPMPRYHRR